MVARVLWPPRLAFVAGTAFVLTYGYHLILQGVDAMASGSAFAGFSISELTLIALLNAIVAGLAVPVVRALDLRFGEQERLAW